MDQTAESHQPVTIPRKGRSAVLISAEVWEAVQETLFLLLIPGVRESIKEEMQESIESCSYEVFLELQVIKVLRLWTRYE